MSETQEPSKQQANWTNNQGYNNANILALRLETQPTLEAMESFLKGMIRVEAITADGAPTYEYHRLGVPKCNQSGLQAIMSHLHSVINSSVVQGNFKEADWRAKNGRHRKQFCKMLITNIKAWEIKDSDIEPICDQYMNLVYHFTSRLIDNKERESYSNYSQSQITQVRDGGSGLFGFFGGKK